MSDLRTELIPASGSIALRGANFFFLIVASAAITVRFQQGGKTHQASGISAAYMRARRAVNAWDRAEIIGTAGTSVTYFYGDEDVLEDVTDFRSQIALIGGTTLIAEAPSSTFTTPAQTALGAASSLDIAANPARRRITVCVESDATNSVWVRDQTATADAGVEIQPGNYEEFKTTAALRVRNNGAAAANISLSEE